MDAAIYITQSSASRKGRVMPPNLAATIREEESPEEDSKAPNRRKHMRAGAHKSEGLRGRAGLGSGQLREGACRARQLQRRLRPLRGRRTNMRHSCYRPRWHQRRRGGPFKRNPSVTSAVLCTQVLGSGQAQAVSEPCAPSSTAQTGVLTPAGRDPERSA